MVTHALSRPHGHTVIEVLVALTILSVSLLAQAGAVVMLTRVVDRGRAADHSALVALTRLEEVRRLVSTMANPCQGAPVGGSARHAFVLESWGGVPSGRHLLVRVVTTRLLRTRPLVDTASTAVPC